MNNHGPTIVEEQICKWMKSTVRLDGEYYKLTFKMSVIDARRASLFHTRLQIRLIVRFLYEDLQEHVDDGCFPVVVLPTHVELVDKCDAAYITRGVSTMSMHLGQQ